jgi:hypothetical protein
MTPIISGRAGDWLSLFSKRRIYSGTMPIDILPWEVDKR